MIFRQYKVKWCGMCECAIIVCPVCKNGSCSPSSCKACHKDAVDFVKQYNYTREQFLEAVAEEKASKDFWKKLGM